MWELAAQDASRERRVELLEAQRNRQRALTSASFDLELQVCAPHLEAPRVASGC